MGQQLLNTFTFDWCSNSRNKPVKQHSKKQRLFYTSLCAVLLCCDYTTILCFRLLPILEQFSDICKVNSEYCWYHCRGYWCWWSQMKTRFVWPSPVTATSLSVRLVSYLLATLLPSSTVTQYIGIQRSISVNFVASCWTVVWMAEILYADLTISGLSKVYNGLAFGRCTDVVQSVPVSALLAVTPTWSFLMQAVLVQHEQNQVQFVYLVVHTSTVGFVQKSFAYIL